MNRERWPFEKLVALAAGELEGEERKSLEAQIAASPELKREYEAIRLVLRTMHSERDSAPRGEVIARAFALLRELQREGIGERIGHAVRIIAQLVFDSRMPAAHAGFRWSGDEEEYHLMFASDIAEIDVQVKHGPSAGSRRIVGQVAPLANPPPPLDKAVLVREGAITHESKVDGRGMFAFTAVRGEYDLVVEMGDRQLVAERIGLE